MIKVTIITACFNNQNTIRDTIESVINQNYPNIEYLIIDGKSTDKTLNILEDYRSKITHIISEKDNGIYDALNKGISLATGDIIGFLHADDFLVHSKVISHYINCFKSEKTAGVYADLQYVQADNTNKIIRNWISGNYKSNSFLWGWMPPHPTLFLRKEVYAKYGVFNLSLKSAADYELMLRVIHKHQITTAYLPEVTVKMRVGGVSNRSLKNRIRANNEDRLAWKLNNLTPYFFTCWVKPLRKLKQYL
ncbi:MAG: glycosyltransferase [Bacteroidia bacterium]|nr:glycosyltransferase [Bacteroidia bacterium]